VTGVQTCALPIYFERERIAARALAQLGALELVAGFGKQRERALERATVAARAVADRRMPAAVAHVSPHRIREGREQRALARIRCASMGGQFRAFEIARRAPIMAEKVILIDPFEIEQESDRLAHPAIGE